MNQHGPHREDLLLGWHLGQLDAEERARCDEELRRDTEFEADSRRMGRMLQPLDHWQPPTCLPNLADRVLRFVDERKAARPLALANDAPPRRSVGASWFRTREILAAAACVAVLMGIAWPTLSEAREKSRQTVCSSHLGALYRGTSTYQETFGGALPYAGYVRNAAWLPDAGPERQYASNSRHVFLLVKLEHGPKPEDFICPSDADAKPLCRETVCRADDFPTACNTSYDSLNLSGESPNVRPDATVAYLGDRSPLFTRAKFNATVDPDKTNSPAHRGRGQSVLTLNGSVLWMTTPLFGTRSDNIWLAGNIRRYTGLEAPNDSDDTQLIPGYPASECGSNARQR